MKPRIFIGSSKEGLHIARAIQEELDHDAETTVWTQGVFDLTTNTLESLLSVLGGVDYGVFVFTPDDVTRMRGKQSKVPRDNVIFELGLSIGRLGPRYSFFVVPRGEKALRLPTDLLGITPGDYDSSRSDGNWVAALGPTCNKIRRVLTSKRAAGSTGVVQHGLFSQLLPEFERLLTSTREVTLFFIHSRRWRDHNIAHIDALLEREKTSITVLLPNLNASSTFRAFEGNFDDGPIMPTLVRDAYRFWLERLQKNPGQIEVRAFAVYPTYSFYKFDQESIVAMYPTVPRRADVPAMLIRNESPWGSFLEADCQILMEGSTPMDEATLKQAVAQKEGGEEA